MVIPVGWLAPVGCWDSHLLELLLSNRLYDTGLEFRSCQGYPHADGCILVLPSRYWVGHYERINAALRRYDWVLAFRGSDEEDCFDINLIQHPNLRWWVQYPRTDRDYGTARFYGVGYPPHFDALPTSAPTKDLDVALSAQNTHVRRNQAFDALEHVEGQTFIQPTEGFTQGIPPSEYRDVMLRAKVCPAPSGVQSPDSFRLYEALESHAIPIADAVSPVDGLTDYWQRVFPDSPFPILTDYESLPGYIEDCLEDWPWNTNRVVAWWMRQKRQMALDLVGDLRELGACA